jgi:WD40 repeat protein/tRNA A-37 threonylcarbamoyl transferase component Bud32
MPDNSRCTQCDAELPPDAPEGLCPKCVLGLGLTTAPGSSETPPLDPTSATAAEQPPTVRVGVKVRYVGDYELLEEIARGGMGVVYKARQASLNRIVAVKMILAGQLASETDVKRFRSEAAAAARLQHKNIVAIHEVGEHEGQHYFSMDFVDGPSLAEVVRKGPLPARQAAQCVKTIAEAVEHAHRQGILHRDLKPSNILLDPQGQPRVTDFGLAKHVASGGRQPPDESPDSGLTATGQVLGTPSYMPPEQATGEGCVDSRSDVYSLGAVLYELLTGHVPFQAETPALTIQQILETEPVAPARLLPTIPRDLDTVCLKCLQKDPQRRYASAQELADDLGRWLDNRPIKARRIGPVGRAARWCQRKPVVATLSGVAIALLLSTVAAIVVGYRETRSHLRDSLLHQARALAQTTAADRRFQALDALERAARIRPGMDLRNEYLRCLDLAGLRSAAPATTRIDARKVPERAAHRVSDDPYWLWFGSDGSVSGHFAFRGSDDELTGILGRDPTRLSWKTAQRPMSLDLEAGQATAKLPGVEQVNVLGLSRDGRWLVAHADGKALQIWDLDESKLVGELKDRPMSITLAKDLDVAIDNISSVAFNEHKGQFAVAWIPSLVNVYKSSVHVYELASLRRVAGWTAEGRVTTLCFNPQRPLLAGSVAGSTSQQVMLWEIPEGRQAAALTLESKLNSNEYVLSGDRTLAFSSNGEFLFAAGRLGTLKAWDITPLEPNQFEQKAPPQEIRSIAAHSARIGILRLSLDGRWMATAGDDGELKLWEVATGRLVLAERRGVGGTLEWSPRGSLLLTGTNDGRGFQLHDFVPPASTMYVVPDVSSTGSHGHVGSLSFSADDRYLACGARLIDLKSEAPAPLWTGRGWSSSAHAFSHDTGKLWVVSGGEYSALHEIPSNERLERKDDATRAIHAIAFDSSGARVAAGREATLQLKVIDADSGKELWTQTERVHLGQGYNTVVATTPTRVTARFQTQSSFEANLKSWDFATGNLVGESKCYFLSPLYAKDGVHLPVPQTVWEKLLKSGVDAKHFISPEFAFSGDGLVAAIMLGDGLIRLYETKSWEPRRTIPSGGFGRLNEDGSRLASFDGKHLIVWETANGTELGKLATEWVTFAFVKAEQDSDGEKLLLLGQDRTVRCWRPREEPSQVCTLEPDEREGSDRINGFLQVSRDGRRAAFCRVSGDRCSTALWGLPDGKLMSRWSGKTSGSDYPRISLSPDGKRLAILHPYRRDKVWNADTDSELLTLDETDRHLLLSRDGRYLAVLGQGSAGNPEKPRIQVLDLTTKSALSTPRNPRHIPSHDWFLSVVSDEARLLALAGGNQIRLYDPHKGEVLTFQDAHSKKKVDCLTLPSGKVASLRLDASGAILASAADDGTILLWSTANGELLATLATNLEKITRVALSPSGNALAAADARGIVQVWDLAATRRQLHRVGLDW